MTPFRWFLLLWFFVISPLLSYGVIYSKDRIVENVLAMADRGDAAGIEALVDWEALCAQLKQSIALQKKHLGTYNTHIGPADNMVAPVVDYYVQPGNLAVLFYLRDQFFAGVPAKSFLQSVGYYPPFGFHMTFGYPKGIAPRGEAVTALLQDRVKVRVIFQLTPFKWRLMALEVPIYLVPAQTYDQPLPEIFIQ